MTPLRDALRTSLFNGYVYAYPHKSAYRRLEPPLPLREVWASESQRSLFLYLHVPFCEYRCGFCNLFTRAVPPDQMAGEYLRQLRQEATRVRGQLDASAAFARLAIGGGTPTFLSPEELKELLAIVEEIMGLAVEMIPAGIECSPQTATEDRLQLLRDGGIDRVSLGVQSFDDRESAAMGRPPDRRAAIVAMERIAALDFPTHNVDLIYGAAGQSPENFCRSIQTALRWRPEELYLYPLYVRPLTGLGRRGESWDDHRLACYRAGRELLLGAGYEQVSMRMFRRIDAPSSADPPYACQSDGMVGLGCGARSYTRALHYSTEYAVGRAGVHEILDSYLQRDADDFRFARHGFPLNADDQRRRYAIISLLQAEGLSLAEFARARGVEALDAMPELQELIDHAFAQLDDGVLRLTPSGLERSDAIGPWLFSAHVHRLMGEYTCR